MERQSCLEGHTRIAPSAASRSSRFPAAQGKVHQLCAAVDVVVARSYSDPQHVPWTATNYNVNVKAGICRTALPLFTATQVKEINDCDANSRPPRRSHQTYVRATARQ
jgi:hypothetical protein